jgi:uncharacterized protein YqjF (DUF2071 family)
MNTLIVRFAEQVNELPYIYNNKQTFKNNKNIDIDTNFQNFENDLFLKNETAEQKEKSSAKKEKEIVTSRYNFYSKKSNIK